MKYQLVRVDNDGRGLTLNLTPEEFTYLLMQLLFHRDENKER